MGVREDIFNTSAFSKISSKSLGPQVGSILGSNAASDAVDYSSEVLDQIKRGSGKDTIQAASRNFGKESLEDLKGQFIKNFCINFTKPFHTDVSSIYSTYDYFDYTKSEQLNDPLWKTNFYIPISVLDFENRRSEKFKFLLASVPDTMSFSLPEITTLEKVKNSILSNYLGHKTFTLNLSGKSRGFYHHLFGYTFTLFPKTRAYRNFMDFITMNILNGREYWGIGTYKSDIESQYQNYVVGDLNSRGETLINHFKRRVAKISRVDWLQIELGFFRFIGRFENISFNRSGPYNFDYSLSFKVVDFEFRTQPLTKPTNSLHYTYIDMPNQSDYMYLGLPAEISKKVKESKAEFQEKVQNRRFVRGVQSGSIFR